MDYAVSPSTDPRRLDELPFTALGGQPAFAAGALERFVRAPRIAVMAYVRADGRPCQSPIWYTLRGAAFHMSTVTGSPKHRALLREPRICLTIQDERPPYRAVIRRASRSSPRSTRATIRPREWPCATSVDSARRSTSA